MGAIHCSPLYVTSPYVRAEFAHVLRQWIPEHADPKKRYFAAPPEHVTRLFGHHPMALEHLVPTLLRVFVDVEFTGAHTQFYDKFNIRQHVNELLSHLWTIPAHRAKWVAFAQQVPAHPHPLTLSSAWLLFGLGMVSAG